LCGQLSVRDVAGRGVVCAGYSDRIKQRQLQI
jgi:hypothetical protein